MTKGEIYQTWNEAVPCLPFPFEFHGGGVKIKRSWADVKEGMYRDGMSTTIHRATGHIAPTAVQSELIKSEIHRQEKGSPNQSPQARSTVGSAHSGGDEGGLLPPIKVPLSPRQTPRGLVELGRSEYLSARRKEKPTLQHIPGFVTANQLYGSTVHLVPPTRPGDNPARFHRKAPGLKDAYRPCGVFA